MKVKELPLKRPLVCGPGFGFLRTLEREGVCLLVNSLIQEEEI